MDRQPTRRRSPWWIRHMPMAKLHALAGKLYMDRRSQDLSAEQEWLFDSCLSELAYRRRHTVVVDWCTCMLCMSTVDQDPDRRRRRRDVEDVQRSD